MPEDTKKSPTVYAGLDDCEKHFAYITDGTSVMIASFITHCERESCFAWTQMCTSSDSDVFFIQRLWPVETRTIDPEATSKTSASTWKRPAPERKMYISSFSLWSWKNGIDSPGAIEPKDISQDVVPIASLQKTLPTNSEGYRLLRVQTRQIHWFF